MSHLDPLDPQNEMDPTGERQEQQLVEQEGGHLVQAEGSIDDAARAFHAANPWVYDQLVIRAREWRNTHPRKQLGISMLWERLRWDTMLFTTGEPLKLNNNYRAFYARLIMRREPDLVGLFKTRHRDSDD